MRFFQWLSEVRRKLREAEYNSGRKEAWKLIREGFTVDDLRSLVQFAVTKDNYRDYDRGMESVADEYEVMLMKQQRLTWDESCQ